MRAGATLASYETMDGDGWSPGGYGRPFLGDRGNDGISRAPGAYPQVNIHDPVAMGGHKVYGKFAEARDKAREELKAKPWLNEKAIHIIAGENPDPTAATAIWEETINRAAVRGTSVEKEMRRTGEGGYYAGYRSSVDPATRKTIEEARDRALAHSNISNYATDNASNQPGNHLADNDRARGWSERNLINGEHFFGPDPSIASHQKAWHDLVADSERGRAADPQAQSSDKATSDANGAPGSNDSPKPALRSNVDPRIQNIVNAAATHLPDGYKIRMTSGYRPGTPNHGTGHAVDYAIINPQGRELSNRGGDPTGMYHLLARHAYGEQRARYPELNGRFAWGGAFGTALGGGGVQDLMHFDINGERGHWANNQMSHMGSVPGTKYGVDPAPVAKTTPNNAPVADNKAVPEDDGKL